MTARIDVPTRLLANVQELMQQMEQRCIERDGLVDLLVRATTDRNTTHHRLLRARRYTTKLLAEITEFDDSPRILVH